MEANQMHANAFHRNEVERQTEQSPLLSLALFHAVEKVYELEKSVSQKTDEAIKSAIAETASDVESMRERFHMLQYKLTVISEVCYSIRNRRPPDGYELALAAIVSIDWPDEWWTERRKREEKGSAQFHEPMSVLDWCRDIRAQMTRLAMEAA